jgi:hypothetical protein
VDLFIKRIPKNIKVESHPIPDRMKKFLKVREMISYLQSNPNGIWIEIDGPKHFIDNSFKK